MNLLQTSKLARPPGWLYLALFLIALASLLLAAIQPSSALAQAARKQVLFINSYHPGYKFSDDVTRAISETFAEQGNIDLRIEYLDTKRVDSPEYLEQVRALYQEKYKDARLDLVMSSDDAALNFLFKYADSLFPNVPVVFVGANFFDTSRLAGYERFTGISEEADIFGTLDTALKIHPSTKQVVVVNDATVTGRRIRQILENVFVQYPQVDFELLEDVSMGEIQQRLGSLPPDSLVLLTIFSRDKDGVFYEYNQFTPLIAESSSVPVYATWDFSLGYGIVGGKLTSGYTEGQRAARMAIRVLNGEAPQTIPVEKQTQAQLLFDYKAMQKWGIDVSQLPEGSTVIDRPISFYEQNAALIWSVSAGFIVLLFVIAFLVINNNQRRLAQRELARANRELQGFQTVLEQRVEERTRALELAAEISRSLSTIFNKEQLATEVVEQLKGAFDYYHAHIYLLAEDGKTLVMTGGTGQAGQMLLERGHSLSVGRGLVGRAAETKSIVLAAETREDPSWVPNPLLPDTQSEIAVPIKAGEQLLGVLDVQNDRAGSLTQQDALLISTVAEQVGLALQNIRATQAAQQAAREYRQLIESAPVGIALLDSERGVFTQANPVTLRMFDLTPADLGQVSPIELSPPQQPDGRASDAAANDYISRAIQTGQANFEWEHQTRSGRRFINEIRLVRATDSSGRPMLNAILTDITERKRAEELNKQRAQQQQALNTITQKIQSATSVEDALQITARELGQALGRKRVKASLEMPDSDSPDSALNHERELQHG